MSTRPEVYIKGREFVGEKVVKLLKGFTVISLATLSFVILNLHAPASRAATLCDCDMCHTASQHVAGWKGCSTCHDTPPQTGAHLVHYNSNGELLTTMVYGDTTIESTADAYKFGCGNCHPLSNVYHQNGTLDVELYNPASPAGSLKAKNPPTAAYTPGSNPTSYVKSLYPDGTYTFTYSDGTCSDVYCHSGYTVSSSGSVGNPLTISDDPTLFPLGYKLNNGFIMDETCSSVQYAPYAVNSGREYRTTPPWDTTGTFSLCTECHQFPLTTWGPSVQAGVGDSHQWYNDSEGWPYGHANNMDYFSGVPCATCHYTTANHLPGSLDNPPTASTTYWAMVNGVWVHAYNPVTIRSRTTHVNGMPDVNFDTTNGYRYYYPDHINTQVDLSDATFDPATKTCSNVACHYGSPFGNYQQKVKWGSPYRGWYGPQAECDQCHRMGNLNATCTAP
jgi:predicted CxxxxCH...CXXCH cytochrome family protein